MKKNGRPSATIMRLNADVKAKRVAPYQSSLARNINMARDWVTFFVEPGVSGITLPQPTHAVPALAPGATAQVPAPAAQVIFDPGAEIDAYALRAALKVRARLEYVPDGTIPDGAKKVLDQRTWT